MFSKRLNTWTLCVLTLLVAGHLVPATASAGVPMPIDGLFKGAPKRMKTKKYQLWDSGRAHRLFLAGGFSSNFKHDSPYGLKGSIDYLISRKVSLGMEAGAYVGDLSFQWKRMATAGLRSSYHFIKPARHKGRNPWNVYGGLSAGIDLGREAKTMSQADPFVDLHLGARYLFATRWLLFAELTGRHATLGLCLRR